MRMVANRRNRRAFQTEDDAARAALAAVPVSDEDPALFWGPDWRTKLQEAQESAAAGRVERYDSDEEFLASLEE